MTLFYDCEPSVHPSGCENPASSSQRDCAELLERAERANDHRVTTTGIDAMKAQRKVTP